MTSFYQINSDMTGIKQALQDLVDNAHATCAMLITQDGEHISHAGDVGFINITALAALVGAMFSATKEVAKLVGELEFSMMIQQGKKRHIHISLAGAELMMVVVFEGLEKTGWVKVQVERQSNAITELMKKTVDRSQPQVFPAKNTPSAAAVTPSAKPPLQADSSKPEESTEGDMNLFKQYASSLLDEIFGQ
jgi:predicted regulator of Ras-like GTPase activity (Roadblock/LC7/MglB family)